MATAAQMRLRREIAYRRRLRLVEGPRRRLRRAPRIPWPANAERTLRETLINMLDRVRKIAEGEIGDRLAGILAGAQARRPTADNAKADDYGDEIARLMSLIRSGAFGQFSDAQIETLAASVAREVAASNKRGVGNVFKTVLGVDVFASEPWLNAEMQGFVRSNVALIKTIPEQYLADVERLVYEGARSGRSYQEIMAELRERPYGKARSRAELIARDQVGKFNGQLAELRQTSAGVKRYTWRTALDARVRDEHAEREGEVFSWDDPPDDGHPGVPVNCRCYGEPYLEDLVDEDKTEVEEDEE